MAARNAISGRDLILIGGSTGAIEALLLIVQALPRDFPAALLVVVHTSADGPGLLPRVLGRAGALPALHPANGDPIEPGRIYVPPPDHHLLLGPDNTIRLRRGPRENGHRPAIDPLFRSAATEGYGARCVAVILSGYLDDGSAGLWAARARGALSIVQDPKDALADDMPANALYYAGADFVLPAAAIGFKLAEIVGARHSGKVVAMKKKQLESKPARLRKTGAAARAPSDHGESEDLRSHRTAAYPSEGAGQPSVFACPECHGVLWEIKEGGSIRYRCRVGHGYSEASLNEDLSNAGEIALWAAMRALDEKAAMARRMADTAGGPQGWAKRLREQAQTFANHAEMLRRMILGEPPAHAEPTAPEPVERDQAG